MHAEQEETIKALFMHNDWTYEKMGKQYFQQIMLLYFIISGGTRYRAEYMSPTLSLNVLEQFRTRCTIIKRITGHFGQTSLVLGNYYM